MVPPMPPWGLGDCNPGFPAWPVFGLKGQSKRTVCWTAERTLLASGDELGVARSGASAPLTQEQRPGAKDEA